MPTACLIAGITHTTMLDVPVTTLECYVLDRTLAGWVRLGPKMYYYAGSQLMVEWTNQHGCGPDSKQRNVHCELILQYTCGEQVRDGLTTGTA